MSRFHDAMKRSQEEQERSKANPARASVKRGRPSSSAHPAYEKIVQRVLGLPGNQRPKVILVVSAVPSEGTSTVARNLANTLGQSRTTRVVLVDANLRTPSQHTAFGVTRANGLSDVIAGTMALDLAVRNGYGPGLSLLTCGRPAKSPPQLLSLQALGKTLGELHSKFDYVILDGPPLTVYSDAAILASLSDGVVLVLYAERTRWEVAEQALRVLEEHGGRVLGAVLNRRHNHIPEWIYKLL